MTAQTGSVGRHLAIRLLARRRPRGPRHSRRHQALSRHVGHLAPANLLAAVKALEAA
jgi:hypothetical protein